MEDNIILSVCIPTYNRAEYLEKTLLSIVSQKRFIETSDVEIIISDNCSEDNTSEVSTKFIDIYGDKIRYYRNTTNIKDTNFEKVLGYGKGQFLKLNNDTLMHLDDTLERMINSINDARSTKDILFFSNGVLRNVNKCYCSSLDNFIKIVSFNSTWIGSFGIWKEDFNSIDDFSRNANLQLIQTDVLLRLIDSRRLVLVDNFKLFNTIPPVTKGGYNIYQVFVANYLGLYKEYRKKKRISWSTVFNEKTKLMNYFLIPWTLNMSRDKTQYSFDKKGALSIVFKMYMFHPIFYLGIIYLTLRKIQSLIRI